MTTIQDYVPRGIPHRPRAIYMDGLNFNHKFFASTEWDLRVAYEQVKQFVRAVQNSNIALKVFLDAISTSDEVSLRNDTNVVGKDRMTDVLQFVCAGIGEMAKSTDERCNPRDPWNAARVCMSISTLVSHGCIAD